jgi:hypothetical protein
VLRAVGVTVLLALVAVAGFTAGRAIRTESTSATPGARQPAAGDEAHIPYGLRPAAALPGMKEPPPPLERVPQEPVTTTPTLPGQTPASPTPTVSSPPPSAPRPAPRPAAPPPSPPPESFDDSC